MNALHPYLSKETAEQNRKWLSTDPRQTTNLPEPWIDFSDRMEKQRDDAREIAEQYIVKNADMQNEIERLNWQLNNQSDTIGMYQRIEDDLTERCGKNDELRQLIGQKNAEIVALLEEIAGLKKPDTITDGGQAFPSSVLFDQAVIDRNGMTLRDWFAGLALQGTMSNPDSYDISGSAAEYLYVVADYMLAARNGKGGA